MEKHELIELKEKIDKKKESIQQAKGQKIALLKQLKKDWNCENLEEAKQLLKDLKESKEKSDKKIEKKTKELEKLLSKDD